MTGAWFSILINGVPVDFFSSTQGVLKGDPLLPVLFILMAEAFSRTNHKQHTLGNWIGAKNEGTETSVTHSFFADDTLLYGESNVNEARKIKKTLDLYTLASGQNVNVYKSKIYLFNTNQSISNRIINILGFSIDTLPS